MEEISTEDLSPAELKELLKGKKGNKYGAKKTEVDGFTFDSAREAWYYGQLKIRERAGEIVNLELQPRFECRVNGHFVCTYIADFRYELTGSGFQETVDVKGKKTDLYRVKKKLVEAIYGIKITEVI